jgi:hypothetical protein
MIRDILIFIFVFLSIKNNIKALIFLTTISNQNEIVRKVSDLVTNISVG